MHRQADLGDLQSFVVLYVDDDTPNLTAFKAAFRKYCTIITSRSMQEGVAILESQPVDLLITDQKMPEGTGIDLLRQTVGIYPDLKRCLITAYGTHALIKEAINAGQIDFYLEKPWVDAEVLAVIRKAYTDSLLKEHQRQLVNQLSRQLHESQQLLLFLRNQLSSPIPESAQRTLDELSQKLRSIEA
jgi:response regulator RpfG family c-di-GMP phosphodiesterase